jgi:hypothetical protein
VKFKEYFVINHEKDHLKGILNDISETAVGCFSNRGGGFSELRYLMHLKPE